jgi:hypothetical protein
VNGSREVSTVFGPCIMRMNFGSAGSLAGTRIASRKDLAGRDAGVPGRSSWVVLMMNGVLREEAHQGA